jgi:hypothetical protein
VLSYRDECVAYLKCCCMCVCGLSSPSSSQQLQQNQLILSLNQSYFQLVTNQNVLVDRLTRLEQLIVGGGSGSTVSDVERSPAAE